MTHIGWVDILARSKLNVLRNINDDRARTAGNGDIEGFMQDAREIVHVLHKIVVLGAGARNANRVAFLKRIVANQVRGNLAGNADQRNGVHHRIGQTGDRIGSAGTRCHQHHAGLAGRARIAFSRVHRSLLMAYKDMLNFILLVNFVIDWQYGTPRVTEHMLNPLIGQCLQDHLRTGHCACHLPSLHSYCRIGFKPPGQTTHFSKIKTGARCACLRLIFASNRRRTVSSPVDVVNHHTSIIAKISSINLSESFTIIEFHVIILLLAQVIWRLA